jgi:SAM-dependent methyltransferase
MPESNNESIRVSSVNILYYNEISGSYDAILNEDSKNALIRAKVASVFSSVVKGPDMLDFGGGTGLDLSWLLERGYRVFFCEPAISMRQLALNRVKNVYAASEIEFLDDGKTDFRNWSHLFPFERKLNAVLANFAVLNCIPDIDLLFAKLALVLEPGGIVIVLMLDNSLFKRFRTSLPGTIKSLLFGTAVSYPIEFKGDRQIVYIHSNRGIRRAANLQFKIVRTERLKGFGFCLIHLVRK